MAIICTDYECDKSILDDDCFVIIMYTMIVKARKFKVDINENWCKGCLLCVALCPKKVLAMKKNKANVVDPDACIGCQLCEIYCPDFAISVSKIGNQNDT
jgi:2-oxoglutarate ferredoxin oxidoreductase subunit delta